MTQTIKTTRRRFLRELGAAGVTAALTPPLTTSAAVAVNDTNIITPREIDDVLVNPGMGFETSGVLAKGRTIRNYPACSIAYSRFYWDELEPQEGRYAFDLINSQLTKAREQGQDIALRFMPMDTTPKAPTWFRAKAKGHTFQLKAYGWERGLKAGQVVESWAPDFNDPFFLERQEALVRAFGERFNGHPDIMRMDIGSIGRWGEWHTSGTPAPMPTEDNAKKVIDWYFKYWGRTPLSMLVGYAPGLRYAVSRGAGWRADSLGDYGHFSDRWCHMVDAYPKQVAAPGVLGAWKRGPVTFEAPGSMEDLERYVPSKGGGYDAMWNQALAWGASSFHAKSHPIPDAQVAPMERFLKRCGYRFVLHSLRYPKAVKRGTALDLQMTWSNLGVAPPYRGYVLAVRLKGGGKSFVLDTDAKLTAWLPGNHQVDTHPALPKDLAAASYELAIGILDPHYREPDVKLAIEGRGVDGWYGLGRIVVI
jgi:hypothetical protein